MPPSPAWQTVQVPFVGGLDTKTARPLVVSGRLLQAQNVVMRERGKVEDRYGFAPIQHPALTNASWCGVLGTGTPGSTALGQELLVSGVGASGIQQLGYTPASSGWLPKGRVQPIGVTPKLAYSGTVDCQNVDVALNFDTPTAGGSYACYAYQKATGSVNFCVYDDMSGQAVMADTVLAGAGGAPRVVAIGPYFVILVSNLNAISAYTINPFQRTVSNPVGIGPGTFFDAREVLGSTLGHGGQYVVVAAGNGAAGYVIGFDPWAQATFGSNPFLGTIFDIGIGVFSTNIGVIFNNNNTTVQVQWFDLALNAAHSQTLDSTIIPYGKVTLQPSSAGCTAAWETLGQRSTAAQGDPSQDLIVMPAIKTASGPINSSDNFSGVCIRRNESIAGDLFTMAGQTYLPTVYQGNIYPQGNVQQSLQPTYFVVQIQSTVTLAESIYSTAASAIAVARHATTNAGGPQTGRKCPQVTEDLAGNMVWGMSLGTQMTAGFNGTYQNVRAVARAVCTFGIQPFSATLGEALYLTGGFLSAYDGTAFVEQNFHLTPEPATVDACNIGCCRTQIGIGSTALNAYASCFIPDQQNVSPPGVDLVNGITFTAVAPGAAGAALYVGINLTSSNVPATYAVVTGNQIWITPTQNQGIVTALDSDIVAYINSTPATSALVNASVLPAAASNSGPSSISNTQLTIPSGSGNTATQGVVPATWTVPAETLSGVLAPTLIQAGTVKVFDSASPTPLVPIALDNGAGLIFGTDNGAPITGTINYSNGDISLLFNGTMGQNTGGTITVSWNVNGAVPETNDVYFPPDIQTPGATDVATGSSGWQIRPGSFIVITAQSNGVTQYSVSSGVAGGPVGYVWFSIDGIGVDPGSTALTNVVSGCNVQCPLLSTDTAQQCAQKFRQAVAASPLSTYVVASPVVQNVSPPTGISSGVTSKVTITAAVGTTSSGPGMPLTYSEDYRLDCYQPTYLTRVQGSWLSCPSGRKIMPGGYFVTPNAYTINGSPVVIVFWYSVNGVGTAPAVPNTTSIANLLLPVSTVNPPRVSSVVQIPINSWFTPLQVAQATNTALQAYAGVATYSVNTFFGTFDSVLQIVLANPASASYLTPYNVNCAGLLPDGQYGYAACFESLNAKGELDQSAPSQTVFVNVQGASPTFDPYGVRYDATGSAIAQNPNQHGMLLWGSPVGGCSPALIQPSLWSTQKQGVTLAEYRTTVSPGTPPQFYRVTDAAQQATSNSASVIVNPNPTLPGATTQSPITGTSLPPDVQVFIDTTPDSEVDGNTGLYTNGSLSNFPMESCRFLIVHRQRMFAVSWENPNVIRPSQTYVVDQQSMVEFPIDLAIPIDADAGNVIGLGTCDAWLIVFCQNGIFAISGDGPTAAGTGPFFNPPNRVMTDSGGCVAAGSIISTPEGLWYQSAKGLYFMNRNLVTSYRGADFTKLVRNRFLNAAVLMPNSTEIRWFSTAVAGSATAVSDYALSMNYYATIAQDGSPVPFLSQFTKWAANSCCLWNGQLVWVDGAANVNVETTGAYLDNGAPIQFLIETAEVHGSLQGYLRASEVLLLGEFVGAGSATVVVQCAYDYEPPSSQVSWNEQLILNPSQGQNGDDGGDQPPLSDGTRFQFRGFIPDGPGGGCFQSIRFLITGAGISGDSENDPSSYGGFALTGIQVNAGFYPGDARLGQSRTAS